MGPSAKVTGMHSTGGICRASHRVPRPPTLLMGLLHISQALQRRLRIHRTLRFPAQRPNTTSNKFCSRWVNRHKTRYGNWITSSHPSTKLHPACQSFHINPLAARGLLASSLACGLLSPASPRCPRAAGSHRHTAPADPAAPAAQTISDPLGIQLRGGMGRRKAVFSHPFH